jgi:hypothetical protein
METSATETAQTGQVLIERIRRNEYMIGLEMSSEVHAAASRLREQLGNALRLLAADLYASDTHFLLELIQNADDNSYPPQIVPTVCIGLAVGELIFFNNELGFTEQNVRALCGVGKSTKAKNKSSGFIGEKGIGFKSVFQVSETPEIHSNGFHFYFDMSGSDGLLGYIVPNWKLPDAATPEVGTTIVLPAKADQTFTSDLLTQLHPKLLLFLRRLRRIELESDAGRIIYERRDVDSVVCVFGEEFGATGCLEGRSSEQYLRLATSLPMMHISEDKREGITTTELVMAFPLDLTGKALTQPGKEVFAFLPIRNFGFRFYIQGDFLLSSSREDILEGRPWNLRLRDSIASAFVMAIQQFKASPAVANGYLNFLPEADEITHDFFKPVVSQLLSALADAECIPCATGEWRKPADVMLVPAGFAQMVSANDALELFGKDYPSPDLEVPNSTLSRLGCKSLSFGDIVTMFGDHSAWLQQRDVDWMIDFYRFVAGQPRKPLLDSGLAKTRTVLDSNGDLRSANTTPIFYPLALGKTFGFEHELVICHEAMARALDEDDGKLRSFFNDIGIRSADPYRLIVSHILPLHENDEWKKSRWTALIGHLCYVKEMQQVFLAGAKARTISEEAAWETLRDGLRIGTKKSHDKGWTFSFAKHMYLGTEYAPDFNIESILGDKLSGSELVSPLYLTGLDKKASASPEELASWREFLFTMGVNPSPRVERLDSGDVRCSKELNLLLGAPDAGTRRSVLECLDRNWSRYPSKQRFNPKGKPSTVLQQYTFVAQLRATIAPSKRRREAKLEASFLESPQLHEAFGDSPHYIDAHLENELFLDACGIRHRPDIGTCVARLVQLKESGHTGFPEVRSIYRFLERLYASEPAAVKQAFRENPVILTRAQASPWKRLSEVVWAQQGKFLDALYPSLQGHYSEFHSFFRKLGISTELPLLALIRALPQLNAAGLSPGEQVAEAMRIYVRASKDLFSPNGDGSTPAWLDEFASGCSFLSTHETMVANEGHLFIDDKPVIGALFRDKQGIEFVAVPPARLPQVHTLLVAAKVPSLSSEVSLRLENPGQGRRNSVLTRRISERHGLIGRLVYSNSHPAFSRAMESGKWATLATLTVEEVDNLVVRAELLGEVATLTGDVVIDGTIAYVRTGVKGMVDRLASEICVFLAVPPALADGVCRILSEPELAGAEEFLEIKGVTELPDEEQGVLFIGEISPQHPEVDWPPVEAEMQEPDENKGTQSGAFTESGAATSASSSAHRSHGASSNALVGASATLPRRGPSGYDSGDGGPETGTKKLVVPSLAASASGIFSPKFRPFSSPLNGGKCASGLINLPNERSIFNRICSH